MRKKGIIGQALVPFWRTRWLLGISLLFLTACPSTPPTDGSTHPIHATVQYSENTYQDTTLSADVLYDKILGLLVGSAIGDALGAPTEMWGQWQIAEEYGFVDSLDIVLREPSPEGPWGRNLPAGAGTDDTRWKALLTDFLVAAREEQEDGAPILPVGHFARFITARYAHAIERLKATEGLEPEPYEAQMRQMTWLQEWARITRAYSSGSIDAYRNSLHRFYGGEMSCAGLLYAPMVGAYYPGRPEVAYEQMYDLALFDLGYARDVSSLGAALTALAFRPDFTLDSIKHHLITIDPAGFFEARLLSRVAYQHFQQAERIIRTTQTVQETDDWVQALEVPASFPYGRLTYARTLKAYELLGARNQDVPFHAGEIYLINLTALLFCELDFQRAMEFIVNFGRDNDTVAALTGSILGAFHGYNALPRESKELVIKVNREVLEIDLEQLARQLTTVILDRRAADQAEI